MKHGLSKTQSYTIWKSIRERCFNKSCKYFPRYGGRGITVCATWDDFAVFYHDMGERPEGMSIDRIDNNGPYSKQNCRWANTIEQANNKRNNRIVSFNGLEMTLPQWERHLGIKKGLAASRFYRGMPLEKVFSTTHIVDKAINARFAWSEKCRNKTHCNNGHEFTEPNTRYTKEGLKRCRICTAAQARKDRARKKHQAPTLEPRTE